MTPEAYLEQIVKDVKHAMTMPHTQTVQRPLWQKIGCGLGLLADCLHNGCDPPVVTGPIFGMTEATVHKLFTDGLHMRMALEPTTTPIGQVEASFIGRRYIICVVDTADKDCLNWMLVEYVEDKETHRWLLPNGTGSTTEEPDGPPSLPAADH